MERIFEETSQSLEKDRALDLVDLEISERLDKTLKKEKKQKG